MPSKRTVVGNADLTPMLPYLDLANELRTQFESLDELRPELSGDLTARYMDEQQPAGTRVYISASRYITSAYEHADALWALVQSDHGLTPQAPWTLMRAIFEHGFWATYLLDPSEGRLRRKRGLQLELLDWSQRDNWINAAPDEFDLSPLRMSEQASASYDNDCRALGLERKTAAYRVDVVQELKKLSIATREDDVGDFLVMTWRALSGHQHGYVYPTLIGGDHGPSVKVAGGSRVTISVNDDWFVMMLKASYALMLEATALFVNRSAK